MLRPLFFEYPEDPTSWLIEDQYLFGTDVLVAPLMKECFRRDVYLPPGLWLDYQSGRAYEGTRWHRIESGEIPVVMLVRDGAAIPHIQLAQSTSQMDWGTLELVVFSVESPEARGLVSLPGRDTLHILRLEREEEGFGLVEDPLGGEVDWTIRAR
jgi:alpha-D-xyloside xylohydrolase